MRLKFFFFPIMLVVSFAVFMAYILPEIRNVKMLNEDYAVSRATLDAVKGKQSAVETIDSQIRNDKESESLVMGYLPEKRVEERILSAMNYLATDSGVSLVNISLHDSTSDEKTGNVSGGADKSAADKGGAGILFTQAEISISADYENILIFMDRLQHIDLFNSIKSVNISSQDRGEEEKASLLANIIVDFGYMKSVDSGSQKLASFRPEFDSSTVASLKAYVSQRISSNDIKNIVRGGGKANPFLR